VEIVSINVVAIIIKVKLKGMVSCPIDPSHIVSANNLESHKFVCSLRKLGVDPDKMVGWGCMCLNACWFHSFYF